MGSMTNGESSLTMVCRDNIAREDIFMSEKMLVTQALDERDLPVKKIADKIIMETVSKEKRRKTRKRAWFGTSGRECFSGKR